VSEREAILRAFLARAGWGTAERRALAGDASFRRYERLKRGRDVAVLMDAPPPKEDVRPFLRMAAYLRSLGLSAPEIMAEDRAAGLLLLEDFGDDTFGRVLARGEDPEPLFAAAIDVLARMRWAAPPSGVPGYLEEEMTATAQLLTDWYLPALTGRPTGRQTQEEYVAIWRDLLPRARIGGTCLVHRDYFADNLMWLPDRVGVGRVGLLDFQDAAIGYAPYDLMSLLQDARRDIAADLEERMIGRYLEATGSEEKAFRRAYAIVGAQRNARIVGLWARLWRRDAKPRYLAYLPRTWDVLERDLAHADLAPLRQWLDRNVPPDLRRRPLPGSPT
jgi:aminoglycoside/choline kinase family phosphotransferase